MRKLRSQQWFGTHGKDGFIHRSWMKNQGIPHDNFDGRPVIGICNTWSELTPCNAHFRELAEYVKRGVREAGGLPLEFPVMSLDESNLRPTAMLFRNLASMDVEESIRGNPLDGVILLVGCDKTTPALLMGAASCNLPALAVFETVEELHAKVDDETLDIDEHCVMVLKGAGPKGYPGFAEVGNMPLPKKILQKGITDMVRISDGRMSGTAYGAVVLHVSPEAAAGGPLALVQTGDMIELDVEARRLHLEVSNEELERRRASWTRPASPLRGYVKLYVDHVLQADQGADLDFLVGSSGAPVPRDSH